MQHINLLLLTDILSQEIRLPLPFPIILIETPVTLVPAHLSDFLRYRIIIEVHVLPLFQGRHHLLYFVPKLPFGNNIQLTEKSTIYTHTVSDKHTILYKQQQEIPDISMPNLQMDF